MAELLAEVVELAGKHAVFPSRWEEIAERAMEHSSVRRALHELGRDSHAVGGVPDTTPRFLAASMVEPGRGRGAECVGWSAPRQCDDGASS